MKKKQTIAIVHYNTPVLTEACIRSIRKTGCQWPVVVFDNSDELPFKKRIAGVKRIDNTQGQIIDFDELLASHPDKCWDMTKLSNYGSLKHTASVQKLWTASFSLRATCCSGKTPAHCGKRNLPAWAAYSGTRRATSSTSPVCSRSSATSTCRC